MYTCNVKYDTFTTSCAVSCHTKLKDNLSFSKQILFTVFTTLINTLRSFYTLTEIKDTKLQETYHAWKNWAVSHHWLIKF